MRARLVVVAVMTFLIGTASANAATAADGLVASYKPAFDKKDPERQDALLPENYLLTVWSDGVLMPFKGSPYDK